MDGLYLFPSVVDYFTVRVSSAILNDVPWYLSIYIMIRLEVIISFSFFFILFHLRYSGKMFYFHFHLNKIMYCIIYFIFLALCSKSKIREWSFSKRAASTFLYINSLFRVYYKWCEIELNTFTFVIGAHFSLFWKQYKF